MKYTREERLDIGKKVYNNEMTKYEASEKYEISPECARDYMRLYRDVNNLPAKSQTRQISTSAILETMAKPDLKKYESMTKEELILELVKARINEARLKKGYEVKGDGTQKVFVPLDSKNTK